jgi:hydroxymethylglutaryl-CoA reductase (NADPH)
MAIERKRVDAYLRQLSEQEGVEALRERLRPNPGVAPPRVPGGAATSVHALEARWTLIGGRPEALADPASVAQAAAYERNIENFIGTVKVPVGLAGPLRVNGLFAHGDFFVPLATTEAALTVAAVALISIQGTEEDRWRRQALAAAAASIPALIVVVPRW